MRRLANVLLTIALAAGTASCAAPTGPAAGTTTVVGTLSITSARPNFDVWNRGTTLVRLLLVDSNVQTLALFAPCDSSCIGIPPGQHVVVPMSAMVGFSDRSTEATITWWQFAPGPNDRVDSSVQAARVRLD